jgi:hypothetical protein
LTPVAVVSLGDIASAIADQIAGSLTAAVPGLQVDGRYVNNPTPPCIDVYPGDPFLVRTAFDVASQQATFVVRARVSTADNEGGQDLMYDLLDPRGLLSVEAAIDADPSLGSNVASAVVEASGFRASPVTGGGGDLLAAEWRVLVEL